MTKNETVGWHHQLNGHDCEPSPGDSEGQGSLACCSPWSHRVAHNLATTTSVYVYTKDLCEHFCVSVCIYIQKNDTK